MPALRMRGTRKLRICGAVVLVLLLLGVGWPLEAQGVSLAPGLHRSAEAPTTRGEAVLRRAAIRAGRELGSRLAENTLTFGQLQPTQLKPVSKKTLIIVIAVAAAVTVIVMYVLALREG